MAGTRAPRTRSETSSASSKRTERLPTTSSTPQPVETKHVSKTSVARGKDATSSLTASKKRKRVDDEASKTSQKTPSRKSQHTSAAKEPERDEEPRLLRFRAQAPKSFLAKLERACTQRMIVVGRTRSGLREDIDVVGSTGNIYKVTIDQQPSCTCPDSLKGNECKHKVYALHTVLKAPQQLQYQRALLTSELEEIFAAAPPLPTDAHDSEGNDGKRKPIEGECPICYMDFDEEHNELVWCKAACGNNMHKSCFDQWAMSQRGKAVRCVYCRTEWEMERSDLATVSKAGFLNEEGYINVAEQYGISRERDYSSYHQPWVRSRFAYG